MVQVFNRDNAPDGNGPVIPIWRLPVHISVSVNAGYDENVNSVGSSGPGSIFTNTNISADYSFGTPRTRATLRTGTGITYYPDLDSNRYDPNVFVDLSVTHQVSLRLSLVGSIHATYQAEPDFATDLGINRRAGNYFSSQASFTASYQWLPRFSTVTSYSPGTIQYDDSAVGGFQNRFDHSFGQSFRFLYLPATTVVAEYRLALSARDNADLSSTTHSLLGGLDHSFLPGLQGTIRAGAELRSTVQNGEENDGISPHVQGNLTYAVGGKTSLSLTASYATEESPVPSSPGSLTFRTGLQLTHSLTGRINCSLSAYYLHGENEASNAFVVGNPVTGFFVTRIPAFSEDSLDFSVLFSYALNRHLSATAGYSRSEIDSEIGARSYSRNRYFGGLTVNF